MSSIIICPDCKRKLKVPESTAGKTFRCPACKSIIPSVVENDDRAPAPAVRGTPSARTAPEPSRSRPPSEEEPAEDIEAEDEEPIREKRPRKKRSIRKKSSSGLLIICLVAGGLGLLLVGGAGIGLIVYLARQPGTLDSEWQAFSPPVGNCTILMPATPPASPGDRSPSHAAFKTD